MKKEEIKQIKPANHRIIDYLQSGNNPYSFNASNGLSMEISFADDGSAINHKLANYFSVNNKI